MIYVTSLPGGLAKIWSQPPDEDYFTADSTPAFPGPGHLLMCDTSNKLLYWEKPVERLSQMELLELENKLLKAQIDAMEGQYQFLEDCIAEMAAQVY